MLTRTAVAVLFVSSIGVAAAQAPGKPTIVIGKIEGAALVEVRKGNDLTIDAAAPGVLVATVDPAGPWHALGVRAGDVIVAVDGGAVTSYDDMLLNSISWRSKEVAYIEVLRKKKPVLLRTVIASPVPRPVSTSPAPDPALEAELDKMIKQTGATTWELDPDATDALLANPMKFTRGARVVPSVKNGQPNGFKLYAIRPSSMWARLGFSNGDTIHSVNGMAITSMDKALEVYTSVRDADRLVVEITRRGKPVTNTYLRRKPAEKL